MASRSGTDAREPEGFVQFWTTGSVAKGEFHCAECSYGVSVNRELPLCPMCGGTSWEQLPWSPFTRGVRDGSGPRLGV
jgi:rubredoxin